MRHHDRNNLKHSDRRSWEQDRFGSNDSNGLRSRDAVQVTSVRSWGLPTSVQTTASTSHTALATLFVRLHLPAVSHIYSLPCQCSPVSHGHDTSAVPSRSILFHNGCYDGAPQHSSFSLPASFSLSRSRLPFIFLELPRSRLPCRLRPSRFPLQAYSPVPPLRSVTFRSP